MNRTLFSAIAKAIEVYRKTRDPQAGAINSVESKVNEGRFDPTDVDRAVQTGYLFRGSSQYYIRLCA